jgi:hypothetical protein
MTHDELPKQMLDRVFHVARLLAGVETQGPEQSLVEEPNNVSLPLQKHAETLGRNVTSPPEQNKKTIRRKTHSF